MNYILGFIKHYWKIFGCALLIILLVFCYLFKEEFFQTEKNVELVISSEEVVAVTEKTEDEIMIFVDVKGAVKKPGVYQLKEGSRVIQAIEASGGLKSGADTSVINLSKKLEDGNVIIIYTKDKIEELKKQEKIVEYIEKECICPEPENTGCITGDDLVIESPKNESDTSDSNEKISLNKASLEELLTLPGIGESKANDILEYRKDKRFDNIEEIKNVKGIGDALFEKIKEHITI